jgi:hypothetical protein
MQTMTSSPRHTIRFRYTGSGAQYAVSKTGKRAYVLGQTKWVRLDGQGKFEMLQDLAGWYDHDTRNPWVSAKLADLASMNKSVSQ